MRARTAKRESAQVNVMLSPKWAERLTRLKKEHGAKKYSVIEAALEASWERIVSEFPEMEAQ